MLPLRTILLFAAVAVAAVQTAIAWDAPALKINGWYPCGESGASAPAPAEGSAASASPPPKIPFECAEVRLPLCHDDICESDRDIDIFVKRIASTAKDSGKAVWFLQGGPGMSSAAMEPAMVGVHTILEGTTAVYTMDHRGTGRSMPLKCDAAQAFTGGSPNGYNVDFDEYPNCIRDLLFQIDNQTAAFSVTSAAKDMTTLIAGLNKDQEVYVYGASYGTYLTERIMHLAPANVRGYVLDGVVSETQSSFAHFGSNRIKPGTAFAKLCESDEVCRTKYGFGIEEHGDLHSAWLAVYKALDNATPGENKCADWLRGDGAIAPSELLRNIFSGVVAVGQVATREFIPAIFKILNTCDDQAPTKLAAIMSLPPGESYYESSWVRSIKTIEVKPFDEITDTSAFLMGLIKNSEMWDEPSADWEKENGLGHKGVFTIPMAQEYASACVLSGDMSNSACGGLLQYGKMKVPPVDYSNLELVPFTYKPDSYHRKAAKIPEGASVMVINGKLDFQTIQEWGLKQYEEMEGDNKMLVEFEYGAHCVGIGQSVREDDTFCGLRIISSFVANAGDVQKTDVSCIKSLPPFNFDVDADILDRVQKATAGPPQMKHKAHHHHRHHHKKHGHKH